MFLCYLFMVLYAEIFMCIRIVIEYMNMYIKQFPDRDVMSIFSTCYSFSFLNAQTRCGFY